MYVSSYCYIGVLILLHMCLSTADLERTLLHVRAAEAALLQVSFFWWGGCTLFVDLLL